MVQQSAGANVAGGARILIVEDHADTLSMMARLLTKRGYAVESAASAKGARAAAAAAGGKFDLVISDLGLPDENGVDLMRYLKASHGLKGIALTGAAMDDQVQAAEQAGFVGHLSKPIDFQKLESLIKQVLGVG